MPTYVMGIGNNNTGRDDRPPQARDSSDRSGLERRDILRLAGIGGIGGVLGLSSIDSAVAVPTDRDDVSKQYVLDDIDFRSIEVEDASVFDLQDNFVILEIKEADEATVPLSADISREDGGGRYVVNAPSDVDVTIPGR